jgi:vanillate O-demethylase ferredoxin subunit
MRADDLVEAETRTVEIVAARREAVDIVSLELTPSPGESLPPFAAGAHIDAHLPDGQIRQYSLVNSPRERNRYVIAVKLERNGRGGSRHLHERAPAGSRLRIGLPRNNFGLPPGDAPLLLIAGGVGITPIRSMIHEAEASGRSWRLHYAAHSRAHAAFFDDLARYGSDRVRFWFSEAGERLDLAGALADFDAEMHLRCCGPARLMEELEAATASWDPARVRFEWFHAGSSADPPDLPFEVELRRSGRRLIVPAGATLLDVLRENGIDVPYACHEGVCGTCETRVLAGKVEHRDHLLSREERAQSQTMMVCVSRARSGKLVLDL